MDANFILFYMDIGWTHLKIIFIIHTTFFDFGWVWCSLPVLTTMAEVSSFCKL